MSNLILNRAIKGRIPFFTRNTDCGKISAKFEYLNSFFLLIKTLYESNLSLLFNTLRSNYSSVSIKILISISPTFVLIVLNKINA